MYDSAGHDLVWRGVVSKTIDPKAKGKQQKNLAKAVTKSLSGLPTGRKNEGRLHCQGGYKNASQSLTDVHWALSTIGAVFNGGYTRSSLSKSTLRME
jgi:hypothetical protein